MHNKYRLVIALCVIAGAVGVGCGSIRVVKRTPTSGELALEGTRSKAAEAARGYMADHCPGGYDILEEGEAVVGQNVEATTTKGRGFFGLPTQTTSASSTDKREWRIKYQCKGQNQAAPQATGSVAPPAAAPSPAPQPSATPASAPPPAAAPKQGKVHELVVRF